MIKFKKYIIVAIALFGALSLSAQDLVILHTNDTHSQIEVMRTGRGAGRGGVHRRAEYFDQVRKENKNVLILDAGDFSQGTPYFTVFRGDLEIELMNSLGYDVAALGNHEFDNGEVELARRLSNAKFDVLCANYDFSKTPLKDLVKPYVIVERGGKKIGIFGLLVNLRNLASKQNIEGLVYLDPYKVSDEIADKLKNKEKCDLVIALTHIGYSGYPNQLSDIALAKASQNIDIVIGGHSHTFLQEEKIYKNKKGKDVIVVQVGCKGEYVGRFDINFKDNVNKKLR